MYDRGGSLSTSVNINKVWDLMRLFFSQNYNSPGSPYWCCKSFITLSLPETHPFWSSQEESYPASLLSSVKVLYKPLHIATNLGGHTYILSSGQQCSYPVKNSAAKYGKLAYSTAFGYSVAVGNGTLEEIGGDNTLALSDDDGETWKCRRETKEAKFEADGKWLRSMWYPWSDVEVETWLIPPTAAASLWHLRVHRIKTGRKLSSAEGGWAIYGQRKDDRALEPSTGEAFGVYESGGEARATSKAGVSGIAEVGTRRGRRGRALRTDANTNLIVPRAVLPTLMDEHEPSTESVWLVTGVFGLPTVNDEEGARSGWEAEWMKRPKIPDELAVLRK